MDDWQVFLDLPLSRALARWTVDAQIELDARQRVLRKKGPLAFGWPSEEFVGLAGWGQLQEPFRRRFLLIAEARPIYLILEVRPDKVIVIHLSD
jgi:hypothetical protein